MTFGLQRSVWKPITTVVLVALGGNASILQGQLPPLRPPDLHSPEIHPDQTVTFRLHAPAAQQVVLWGEWMPKGQMQLLNRDSEGSWSAKVGPLRPDVYLYAFGVDGVRLADPNNPQVKNGYPGLSSMFEIPGADMEFMAIQDVLHGTIHVDYYRSGSDRTIRRVHVYTPPGFTYSRKHSYPTMYLLHGSWDSDADWSGVGRAGVILDNLIAQGKAVPMLLVMPDGHPVQSFEPSTRARNLAILDRDIIEDLFPFVEQHYRASRQARDRAIAGISMGGTQALHIGLKNLNQFGAIAVMSAPGDVPNSEPFAEAYARILQRPAEINAQIQLFWLACGHTDDLLGRAKEVDEILTSHGIHHVWHETEGAHTWMTWRRHLAELAPLLFRP